jgi:hypothetical protein
VSPLLYIVKRSLVNIVKGLAKKPALLALYIIIAILSIGMIVVVFIMPGNYSHGEPVLFRSIITALTIIVIYFSIKQGIEKGSSFFRAADVSLVFTGPHRPNDVLLYGFIKQLGGMVLAMFIAMYQIPNLKNNFPLQPYGTLVVILAVAVFALSYPIFGMMVYAFTSKSKARKRIANTILNVAAVLVLLSFLYQLYETRDLLKAAYATFDGPAIAYIPVIGWMRSIGAAAVDGINVAFWAGLGLMIAAIAGFIVALYRLNLDYYEEVLDATDQREAAIAAKKEGTNMQFNVKARHKVKEPLFGQGASVLFGKNMLELRKSSFVLFFDRTSLIVIIAALAFNFIMPAEIPYRMFVVLAFSVYMLFLMLIQGRWPMELARHYIFTLPARPVEKLFFVTASDHLKNLIDGMALFIIAGIFFKASVPLILACILSYLFMGALFVYTDVMARRLFGSVHSKPLVIFLKLFLTVFIVTPGIGGAIALALITHIELLAVAAFGLWALLAAGGIFLISAGIFKNIEVSA